MTIYLFIDLPFNEIGCYPPSLKTRGGKKEKEKKGVWWGRGHVMEGN